MTTSIALALFALGLLGAPHCVAMCGLACPVRQASWAQQLGRLTAYACLGAVAGASVGLLAELATHSQALRPVWTLLYLGSAALGLWMVIRGVMPGWLALRWGQATPALSAPGDAQAMHFASRKGLILRRYLTGLAWVFAPCGLLYSALSTAGLTGSPASAAAAMLAFGLGTALGMQGGQRLLGAMRGIGGAASVEAFGTRVAGGVLASLALVAVYLAYSQPDMAWCAPRWG